MKVATISELKTELNSSSPAQLVEICIRLAKFKKDNKELMTYLLFEFFDEHACIENIKKEMQVQFEEINKSNVYFVKKSLRKILRFVNKHIRFIASTEAEINLLLSFCTLLRASGAPVDSNPVIKNIYQNQVKKITKSIATMHEDLQYDYEKQLKLLS